jgi:hypothetical protein
MVVRVTQIARLLIILASRHRSLVFENLALRQQLAVYHRTRPKPIVRWPDRLFWVGLRLAWPDWKSALVIVRPATVIAWHRRAFAWYWTRQSCPSGGRPQVGADVRRLIREMALTNPLWGAPRIHGELLKLGFDVSERTVSRLMPRRRTPPSQTWRTFLENHLGSTVAIDFFAVPTLTCRILVVLVILAHDRRRILHVNVTPHPTSAWTRQQLGEACPYDARRGSSSTTATRHSARRSVGRSRPSASRPSARHRVRPGRTPTSNASSAQSAASVWTTSSSSMSGIFVGSFGSTSRTTSGLGHASRSARMLRWNAPSNRRAASWCDPKSAVCTTATNGKPPDSSVVALGMRLPLDVENCLRAHSTASPNGIRRLCGRSPTRMIQPSPFSANRLRWKIVSREAMAMDNVQARARNTAEV